LPTTSASALCSPSSATSSVAVNQSGAARARRSSAISATLVSPRSAESLYEPSERSIEIEMRFREFVILFDIWSPGYFMEPKWIGIEHPQ